MILYQRDLKSKIFALLLLIIRETQRKKYLQCYCSIIAVSKGNKVQNVCIVIILYQRESMIKIFALLMVYIRENQRAKFLLLLLFYIKDNQRTKIFHC